METLTNLYTIAKVALGLGFVIFLHELGHFLAAKWNGVKVERFAIGFDFGNLRLWSKQIGETVYVLGAIPLGGYVKMLGEGDQEEGGEKTNDPRAFCNKSVGARMVIMSAGVVMNLLLGLACFALVYTQGTLEMPAKIGVVLAGSPAYLAGLQPGDEIVTIDGRPDPTFQTLQMKVKLSGDGQIVRMQVRRPGTDALRPIDVEPRVDENSSTPAIGILPSEGLELAPQTPFDPPAGYSAEQVSAIRGQFRSSEATIERVVAAGPAGAELAPVESIDQLQRILDRHRDEPVAIRFRRTEGDRGLARTSGSTETGGEDFTVTFPPNPFLDLGFRAEIEPVLAVQPGSPAARADLRKGDRIVKVDGRDDFDPFRLPSLARQRAGQPMTLEVERPSGQDPKPKVVTLTMTPDDTPAWVEPVGFASLEIREPLEVPGLGFAYQVRPVVVGVAAGSPAERAGLKAGDHIASVSLPAAPAAGPDAPQADDQEPRVFPLDGKQPYTLGMIFAAMQVEPKQPITFNLVGGQSPVTFTPEVDSTWNHPLRGLQFLALTRVLPPQGLASALSRGLSDTMDRVTDIYAMFRGLIQSRVSRENLAGLPRIAGFAYQSASAGLVPLLNFLGMLSVNLAVLNFLPIPPLDGGQMVFLIAEKVRGRPLPDKAVTIGMLAGLALVLGLMLFTIVQDIFLIARGRG